MMNSASFVNYERDLSAEQGCICPLTANEAIDALIARCADPNEILDGLIAFTSNPEFQFAQTVPSLFYSCLQIFIKNVDSDINLAGKSLLILRNMWFAYNTDDRQDDNLEDPDLISAVINVGLGRHHPDIIGTAFQALFCLSENCFGAIERLLEEQHTDFVRQIETMISDRETLELSVEAILNFVSVCCTKKLAKFFKPLFDPLFGVLEVENVTLKRLSMDIIARIVKWGDCLMFKVNRPRYEAIMGQVFGVMSAGADYHLQMSLYSFIYNLEEMPESEELVRQMMRDVDAWKTKKSKPLFDYVYRYMYNAPGFCFATGFIAFLFEQCDTMCYDNRMFIALALIDMIVSSEREIANELIASGALEVICDTGCPPDVSSAIKFVELFKYVFEMEVSDDTKAYVVNSGLIESLEAFAEMSDDREDFVENIEELQTLMSEFGWV